MAIDDMMQALQAFKQGVNDLQTNRILSQANEQVDQIRNSEAKEEVKNNQLRGLAQQLTFGLAAQGAPVSKVEQVVNAFNPAKPVAPQTLEQGLMSADPVIQARAQRASDNKSERELKKAAYLQERQDKRFMAGQAATDRRFDTKNEMTVDKRQSDTLTTFQKDYQKNVKEVSDAARYASNGLKILDSGGPAEQLIAAVQFAAARAAGSNSQLSDGERLAFSGRQDWLSQLKQAVATKTTSTFIKENKAAIRDLLNVYASSANTYKKELANHYAGNLKANDLFKDQDPDILIRKVSGGDALNYTGKEFWKPNSGNMDQAEAPVQAPAGGTTPSIGVPPVNSKASTAVKQYLKSK